jgi:hypothetical protein
MPNAPTTPSTIGAILLFKEEPLLLNESRQLNLENPKKEIIGHRCLFQ